MVTTDRAEFAESLRRFRNHGISNDAQQRYLYVADGMNKTVWIVQRDTLTPVSRFGDGGRNAGRFYAVGSVAVDSKGNVYTGEDSDGKRVQKWINKGMGPAQLN